jgi:hypothetical protein
MFDKSAINFLKIVCSSLFCRTIVWQGFKLSTGFLKHITCKIGWNNTPFSTNNCLTRIQDSTDPLKHIACTIGWRSTICLPDIFLIQTFHRLSETFYLYNRIEKYACFAKQLFEKNSNFPQTFWSKFPVQLDGDKVLFCRTIVWQEFKLAH